MLYFCSTKSCKQNVRSSFLSERQVATMKKIGSNNNENKVPMHVQSWPKTMWTVAFDQLFKQKSKIYRSFFNPPAPLNNVVFQYVA